jgi:hypothetical protein
MASPWTETALAALWGRQKTDRLVAEGLLKSYHTDAAGRRYYAEGDVMAHYAYKSPDAPGVACCVCCGHCTGPGDSGRNFAKAFAPGEAGEYERADEYVPDNAEENTPLEYLEGDYPPDDDLEDGDLDEPDDGGDFDLGGEGIADYLDRRLKSLDTIENGDLGALAEEVAEMALEGALISLQAERLAFGRAARRLTGGERWGRS